MSKFTDTIYILSIFICNISIIDTISEKKNHILQPKY